MWAVVIFILLPTGQALTAERVTVFPTEALCKEHAGNVAFDVINAVVEQTQIPLAALKPLVACKKVDAERA